MEPRRPDPDALLRRVRAEEDAAGPAVAERREGRLKVFLGAAPGVGKTYEMLREALDARAQGVDVVAANTEGRTLGLLGEPRVNVLTLNLALDALRPLR